MLDDGFKKESVRSFCSEGRRRISERRDADVRFLLLSGDCCGDVEPSLLFISGQLGDSNGALRPSSEDKEIRCARAKLSLVA